MKEVFILLLISILSFGSSQTYFNCLQEFTQEHNEEENTATTARTTTTIQHELSEEDLELLYNECSEMECNTMKTQLHSFWKERFIEPIVPSFIRCYLFQQQQHTTYLVK
jgi:hypothetical protein